jgi:hypothetical protein
MTAKPVWPLWMIINQLEGDDPLNPQIHPWDHPNSTLTLDAQGNAYWVPVITYSMTGIARDHNWVSGTSEYMSQAVPPINDDVSAKIATAFELWDDLIAPSLRPTDDPNSDIAFNFTCAPMHNPATFSQNNATGGLGVVDVWIPYGITADDGHGNQVTVDYQDPAYGSHGRFGRRP